VRGLKTPPRSMTAPYDVTASAVARICSRDSTLQGPPTTTKWPSPITTLPTRTRAVVAGSRRVTFQLFFAGAGALGGALSIVTVVVRRSRGGAVAAS